MALSKISLAFAQARQSGCGAGFGSRHRGEKTDYLIGEIVGQNCGDQMRQQPGSCPDRIGGRQFIQSAQGLEPFEADLDLPAIAIERGHPLHGLGVRRQRGVSNSRNPAAWSVRGSIL